MWRYVVYIIIRILTDPLSPCFFSDDVMLYLNHDDYVFFFQEDLIAHNRIIISEKPNDTPEE